MPLCCEAFPLRCAFAIVRRARRVSHPRRAAPSPQPASPPARSSVPAPRPSASAVARRVVVELCALVASAALIVLVALWRSARWAWLRRALPRREHEIDVESVIVGDGAQVACLRTEVRRMCDVIGARERRPREKAACCAPPREGRG